MSQDSSKLARKPTYQSIVKFDGADPAAFKIWDLEVCGHYETWDHGSWPLGTWAEHIKPGGVYTSIPGPGADDNVLHEMSDYNGPGTR